MTISPTTLLHQLKNQLDESHLHAKITFARISKTKTFVTVPLSSIFLRHFPFFPIKNISYLDFDLQHRHPGIFTLRRIRSRENREKYPSQWARFACMQNHSSVTTGSKEMNLNRESSSVPRKYRYESTVSRTTADSACSSQYFYWILVLPLSSHWVLVDIYNKTLSPWPLFVARIVFSYQNCTMLIWEKKDSPNLPYDPFFHFHFHCLSLAET